MEKEIKNLEPSNSNIGVDPYWEVRREAFRNGYDAAESGYWKKFRREAAKDILCAILYGRYGANPEHFTMAIEIADELVRKLLEVDTLGTQQVIAGKMPQKRAEWSEEDEKMVQFWNMYYEHKVGDWPNKDVVERLKRFQEWFNHRFRSLRAGAEWQKAKMMEGAVEGVAEELYNDGDVHCTVGVGTNFKPGDKVRVIVIPEEK